MKDKLKKFTSNRNLMTLTGILAVMTAINIYFYIDSSYMIEPLLRIILFSISIPALFLFEENSIPYLLSLIGLTLTQTISFTNYTPFVLIFIACSLKDKWTLPLYLLYAADIVIVCMRHDKTPLHLVCHIGICMIIYYFLSSLISRIKKQKPLDLTKDEEYIVSELAKGKIQKEIEGYSENTVSKKLKVCRNKNGCVNNEELVAIYRQSIKSNS